MPYKTDIENIALLDATMIQCDTAALHGCTHSDHTDSRCNFDTTLHDDDVINAVLCKEPKN